MGRKAPLGESELTELLAHPASCRTGRHSDAALEAELGLDPGGLVNGSPAHGLLSERQRLNELRSYFHWMTQEETPEPARTGRRVPPSGRAPTVVAGDSSQELGRFSAPTFPTGARGANPAATLPVKALAGHELACLSPIRGLLRQRGDAIWLPGMFRLDFDFADGRPGDPTSMVLLWRFSPHWESFPALPAAEMVLFLISGSLEWQEVDSGASHRLSAGRQHNLLWVAAGGIKDRCLLGLLLRPFRVRQTSHQDAVALAVLYSPAGLPCETGSRGQVSFRASGSLRTLPAGPDAPFLPGLLHADRVPRGRRELADLLSNAASVRGDCHDPARQAGQLLDRDLPGWSRPWLIDSLLQVRLARFSASAPRSEQHIVLAGHAGLEVVVPLCGSVEVVCGDPRDLCGPCLERGSWALGDFAPDRRIHSAAASAGAPPTALPGVLLLRSRYPHAFRASRGRAAFCLHLRCLTPR